MVYKIAAGDHENNYHSPTLATLQNLVVMESHEETQIMNYISQMNAMWDEICNG